MTLITPSKWLSKLVKESFLGKYAVKVIYNGIDLNIFKPTPSDFRQKYNIQNKKIILGVSNQWTEKKGFNDFIKLSYAIDDNYQIVLVGLNEEQLKKIPHNIVGINRTHNTKELAEIYTAADVLLNLSRQETMGLITVEAYACGTPVIVSNLTAVPEVVNKNCGVIIDDINNEEIIKEIKSVLDTDWSHIIDEAEFFNKYSRYNEYLEECYIKTIEVK